jgi:putative spermidine/putrescine transport system permease protein
MTDSDNPLAPGRWLTYFAAAIYLFLLVPVVIVLVAAFNAGEYLTFPPQGLSLRWFEHFFQRQDFTQSLRVSLQLALASTAITSVLGTMAALTLVRYDFRGQDLLNSYVLSPLILPQILTGVGLLAFFSRLGLMGSFQALLLGHIVICLPYVVRTVVATLCNFDRTIEEAAQNLGTSAIRAFFSVTLPVIRPGVAAGAVMAFVTSFDNFTLSLFLISPQYTTLPIEVFSYIKNAFDPTAAAAAAIAVGFTLVALVLTQRFVGLEEFTGF